ncbi:protein prenyltransferase alpha subunit repeat-containing protein 1-A isoform X2 [Pieris brassicae]|uniref:protein prenyltransferase alpha subunit repeat-containing protein 1-A isoform X2 n=1 Tax=Pieris brassicae TaxID=7116 RepID=UPI001E660839|nr:protein prenyltransferase alpha subunit repeat-containing protein 1-A isoform X2 [Pieris brassicae]
MADEKQALVEKIIKDVHIVLSNTAELYAFDIVPVETNFRNKSPVMCIENCLGLESWCVKQVYLHSYTVLMDKMCFKTQRKSRQVLDSETLLRLLNVTLLINPDLSVLWNKRREMVQELLLDKSTELKFTRLVLSRKPKCNDAFAHRRWILGTYLNSHQINTMESLINTELSVCDLTADKCPNNYHSWSHRLWFINKLRNSIKQDDMHTLYIKEYNFSERWMSKHVSDFSCFHYRQFCIKNTYNLSNLSWKTFENSLDINFRKVLLCLLVNNFPKDMTIQASEQDLVSYSEENLIQFLLSYNNSCSCNVDSVSLCRKFEILCYELTLNSELLRFYKHHESMWYHRRFILHEIIEMMYDHFGLFRHNGVLVRKSCKYCKTTDLRQKQAKIIRSHGDCLYKSVLFQVIIKHEKSFIQERNDDNHAVRHEKYLKLIQGLNNLM